MVNASGPVGSTDSRPGRSTTRIGPSAKTGRRECPAPSWARSRGHQRPARLVNSQVLDATAGLRPGPPREVAASRVPTRRSALPAFFASNGCARSPCPRNACRPGAVDGWMDFDMTLARTVGGGTNRGPDCRDTGTDTDTDTDEHQQLQPVSNGATHAQLIAQLLVLQQRTATMPEIEQAKGALMLAYGLTADDAFALLRSYSQNRNVKLRDIAAWLTENLDTVPRCAAAARKLDHLLKHCGDRMPRGCHGATQTQGDVPMVAGGSAHRFRTSARTPSRMSPGRSAAARQLMALSARVGCFSRPSARRSTGRATERRPALFGRPSGPRPPDQRVATPMLLSISPPQFDHPVPCSRARSSALPACCNTRPDRRPPRPAP